MSDGKVLGQLEAVAGTFNRVDHDREVYLPGCFPEGAPVFISAAGHDVMWGGLPVGIGTLHSVLEEIIVRARYFVEFPRCAEAFGVIQRVGELAEYSLGFIVRKALEPTPEWQAKGAKRLLALIEPVDCSFVARGASLGTRTVSAKREAMIAAAAREEFRRFQVTVARVTPTPPPMSLAEYFRLSDTEFMARMADRRRQVA